MSHDLITQSIDERGVVRVTLCHAARHNALSQAMIAALDRVFADYEADPACRLVCLYGAGKSFCAGGDLGWMKTQMEASRKERIAAATELAALLRRIDRFPKPVIGCVTGNAFGGGVGLMAVCDEVLVIAGARFGLTEARLGLIPATISPYVVGRIGRGHARHLVLSAQIFDSEDAVRIGLAHRVVPPDDFAAVVESRVSQYLATSPQAVAAAKRLIRNLPETVDDATIAYTVEALADCWDLADAAEGVTAFFEKRPPRWTSDAE